MMQDRKSEQMTTSETVAAKVAVYKWIRELVNWLEKETKAELADQLTEQLLRQLRVVGICADRSSEEFIVPINRRHELASKP